MPAETTAFGSFLTGGCSSRPDQTRALLLLVLVPGLLLLLVLLLLLGSSSSRVHEAVKSDRSTRGSLR